MMRTRYVLPLIAALLLAACAPSGPPASAPAEVAPAPAPEPATKPDHPALVVETVDGRTFDLAQHRGHWVVVNFWATWCTPCLAEIPELVEFDRSRDDVDVVGLAYEDITPQEMAAFLEAHPIAYPVAILDTSHPPADFETPQGLPMTYLIAPDGKVARRFLGPTSVKDLTRLIQAAGSKTQS
jgi:thiol-disulfide isomerase/thioredoxin